jgi:hypothetical protein
MKYTFLAMSIAILHTAGLFSQEIKQKLIYELQPDERIIMGNEHMLAVRNGTAHYILFLQKDSMKYIVFDEKKYGPFEYIEDWKPTVNMFNWAVKKDDKWYQLILDYDLLLGPYDEVGTVARDEKMKNFAFKARIDTTNFIIMNNQLLGPDENMVEMETPDFSPEGNNYSFLYVKNIGGKQKAFIRYRNEDVAIDSIKYNWACMTEDGYDYYRVSSLVSSYRYYGSSTYYNEDDNGVRYYMKNKPDIPVDDKWEIGEGAVESHARIWKERLGKNDVYVFATDEKYITDKNGVKNGPYNEIITYGCRNKNKYAILKNYYVKDEEEPERVPVYSNFSSKNLIYELLPTSSLSREKFILVNNKTYGPFTDVVNYTLRIGDDGKFACLVNPDSELYLNGSFTGIKNVSRMVFRVKTSQAIVETPDSSLYLDTTYIGKFDIKSLWHDIALSDGGKNLGILHTRNNKKYIYLTAFKKNIGPIERAGHYVEWVMSKDGKNVAYNNGFVSINQKPAIDSNAFSLSYSSARNSFCWLSLYGRKIYRNEYLLAN